ncbi:MAG: ribosome biogenesis GTPase Der [Candidatus Latescibacteria bacterium]|nr:ribosome biogenesis GTPase Der [Candidatus Latescibacterota bacterium]
MPKRKPVVAIVGRPNVGKSTLFNRFLGERRAVVHDQPGVTRDRNYGEVSWNRREFTLIDTGGYIPRTDGVIEDEVVRQVETAVSDADVIVMVGDAKTGPTDYDTDMARLIQKCGKPYLLVVNKVDSERDDSDAAQFYNLGMGDPVAVSALSGRLSGDLLDEVIAKLPEGEELDEEDEGVPRLAVVGRPNVGKSTFVNRLAGEDRVVVSPIPGTTRDAIDLPMRRNGRDYLLIDTAGLRRRSRVTERMEYYSVLRTTASLDRSDVAIVLTDAEEGCTAQDAKIVAEATDLGKGAVLVINKWDLIEKDDRTAGHVAQELIGRFPSLRDYPIVFTSALTGQRTWRAIDAALEVFDRRASRIPTGQLNRFLASVNLETPPPSRRGRHTKMFYCVQPRSEPPTVVFFTSRPQDVPEHYKRFLERKLRETFDFEGTPIRVTFRPK